MEPDLDETALLADVIIVHYDYIITSNTLAPSTPCAARLPVLRLFGSVPDPYGPSERTNVIIHVHGLLPSVSFRLAELPPSLRDVSSPSEFTAALSASLEHLGLANVVYDTEFYLSRPFYGWHKQDEPFARVRLTRPGAQQTLLAAARRGDIGGKPIVAYEAHVPYFLRVCSDLGITLLAPQQLYVQRCLRRAAPPATPSHLAPARRRPPGAPFCPHCLLSAPISPFSGTPGRLELDCIPSSFVCPPPAPPLAALRPGELAVPTLASMLKRELRRHITMENTTETLASPSIHLEAYQPQVRLTGSPSPLPLPPPALATGSPQAFVPPVSLTSDFLSGISRCYFSDAADVPPDPVRAGNVVHAFTDDGQPALPRPEWAVKAGAAWQGPPPVQMAVTAPAQTANLSLEGTNQVPLSVLALEVLARPPSLTSPASEAGPILVVVMELQVLGKTAVRREVHVRSTKPVQLAGCRMKHHLSEHDLIHAVIESAVVADPDILCSFCTERGGWGLLAARAAALNPPIDVTTLLGRVARGGLCTPNPFTAIRRDTLPSLDVRSFTGRILVSAGSSAMRGSGCSVYGRAELARHVLGTPFPEISDGHLAAMWTSEPAEIEEAARRAATTATTAAAPALAAFAAAVAGTTVSAGSRLAGRAAVLQHMIDQTHLCHQLLAARQTVGSAADFAHLYGLDLLSVLTRGSQFRTEAVLLRIARPRGWSAPSPSPTDVARMRAPEATPLVLEPISAVVTCPVLVLDFESLYPTVTIAYNMCYSTCIGRGVAGSSQLGALPYELPAAHLATLDPVRDVFWAPNRVGFLRRHILQGCLPRMLSDVMTLRRVINSNIALIDTMDTDNSALRGSLHRSQQACKMLANTALGYTNATYSGRMPCIDIGDAVVGQGRRILEQLIDKINNTAAWAPARVIYGDTDSVFIALPHLTSSSDDQLRAFTFAEEVCAAASEMFPAPIRLKIEKLYLSSAFVTKKRYAGYAVTNPGGKPKLDIKGMESVRRDVPKVVANALSETMLSLFRTGGDLSAAAATCRTWLAAASAGLRPVRDYCFSREVNLTSFVNDQRLGPAAAAALAHAHVAGGRDLRALPLPGTRVPFLVAEMPIDHVPTTVEEQRLATITGRSVHPADIICRLRTPAALPTPDGHYYTDAVTSAVGRVVRLAGVEPAAWTSAPVPAPRSTAVIVGDSLATDRCLICSARLTFGTAGLLCTTCVVAQLPAALYVERGRVERMLTAAQRTCRRCAGAVAPCCEAPLCPLYEQRMKLQRESQVLEKTIELIEASVGSSLFDW